MSTDYRTPPEVKGGGDEGGRPSLTLDLGEAVTLSPESKRFGGAYKQYHPQSIAEVGKLLGVGVAHNASAQGSLCCRVPELSSIVMTPDHLKAEDPAVVAKANRLSYLAAREILAGYGAQLAPWTKTVDAWLLTQRPIVNVAWLGDIDIAPAATLNLSASTHALYANKITIRGTGRLVCSSSVTVRATSLEGTAYGSLVNITPVVKGAFSA
jgi:hypothetical protein